MFFWKTWDKIHIEEKWRRSCQWRTHNLQQTTSSNGKYKTQRPDIARKTSQQLLTTELDENAVNDPKQHYVQDHKDQSRSQIRWHDSFSAPTFIIIPYKMPTVSTLRYLSQLDTIPIHYLVIRALITVLCINFFFYINVRKPYIKVYLCIERRSLSFT